MGKIQIKNINLGGLADSKYLGAKDSVYRMVGLDLHSTPGLIKVNQALVKESGTTIDGFVKTIIPCTDGNTYLFSSTSGKIWKRTTADPAIYSLVATNANGAMYGAIEDQGYLYYFSNTKIGRWEVGTAWSTRNDSWATFTNGDSEFHPAVKVNLICYIGDGNLVAQIEDGVFTANALDLKAELRIKSLGQSRNELLIGTYVNDNINETEIFKWNTWSKSFSYQDPIPQVGINAFIPTDNYVLVSAGKKGGLYLYSQTQLEQFKRIPGNFTLEERAVVHPNAIANKSGLPLFGLSNENSNPALQGVYSFGNYSKGYPLILNLEYVISQNKLASIEIGAMRMIGDLLIVSWKDGTTYGVDKLDLSNKYASAYVESRVITVDRTKGNKYGIVRVAYASLPTDTGIKIYKSVNYGAYSSALTTKNDTIRKIISTTVDISNANTLQIKVATTIKVNNAPEIEMIEIDV